MTVTGVTCATSTDDITITSTAAADQTYTIGDTGAS